MMCALYILLCELTMLADLAGFTWLADLLDRPRRWLERRRERATEVT